MKYREPKQKPVNNARLNKAVNTQEFSTSRVYKLGQKPHSMNKKESKNRNRFIIPQIIWKLHSNGRLIAKLKKTTASFKRVVKHCYGQSSRRQKITTLIVTAVLLSAGIIAIDKIITNKGNNPAKVKGAETKVVVECPGGNEKPKFDLIFPAGKDAKSLGGICRTSPKTSAPVFTYRDKIGNIKIKVNQQVVPRGMAKPEDLSSFAKQNYYNEMFMVNETKVYAGQSARGEQFLVLVKNNLLIFITADKKIDINKWVEYISLLF
jgi:hypothetical protein